MKKKQRDYFKNFSFNILTEKPHIKHSKNKYLLYELPFYDELSKKEISRAF